MKGSLKLERSRTQLVVVDVQEAFAKAVLDFERVAQKIAVLAESAAVLDLPVTVSEQYPKGLGRTVAEVAAKVEGIEPVEKLSFSACGESSFLSLVEKNERDQVMVCGIESHVCVWQTVLDLANRGFSVHVVRDAVSSRSSEDLEVGLKKMEQAGAVITTVETALFELLERAGSDEFKAVQRLVK